MTGWHRHPAFGIEGKRGTALKHRSETPGRGRPKIGKNPHKTPLFCTISHYTQAPKRGQGDRHWHANVRGFRGRFDPDRAGPGTADREVRGKSVGRILCTGINRCGEHSSRRTLASALKPSTRTLGRTTLPVQAPSAYLFDVAPGGVLHAGPVARTAVSSYLAISPLPAAPSSTLLRRCTFCSTVRRTRVRDPAPPGR